MANKKVASIWPDLPNLNWVNASPWNTIPSFGNLTLLPICDARHVNLSEDVGIERDVLEISCQND